MQIQLALAKGRVAKKAIALLGEVGYTFPDYSDDSRKLIFTDSTGSIAFFLVKSPDVPTYVAKGVADIGIVGRDVLMEHPAPVYELLNLNIGRCRICVAGMKDSHVPQNKKIVVGTKYPNIAKHYYNEKKQPVDIIYLNGSVELAPILGLSDYIVDIVETGSTLKENGLVVLEEIAQVSSRLIANKVSLKTKRAAIDPILEKFDSMRYDD